VNAAVTSQRIIPATLLDPKIKNRSRIHYLMANIEASKMEGENNWALLLDPDGFIAEGTGDNFFIVKDGVVITPEGRNCLRGVSRAYILKELGPLLGIPVVEKNIEPYDVMTADEAFMTGTPFCMIPVTTFNRSPVGDGKVGPVYRQLLKAWGDQVGVDIAGQIKAWDAARTGPASDAPTPYAFRKK
jgi:branched-chain amino acid aminotransferase